jgi:hypothetical protein
MESNDLFFKILRELRALRGKELIIIQFTRRYRASEQQHWQEFLEEYSNYEVHEGHEEQSKERSTQLI